MIILLELALILTLLLRLSSYSVYFFIFLVVINVVSLFAVINDEGNPEYKLTWMGVILLVPFLGVVMWLLFRRRNMTPREVRVIGEVVDTLLPTNGEGELSSLAELSPSAAGKARSLLSIDNMAEVFLGTHSKYFKCGKEMYESMLRDIDSAEKFIFLEYFIISPGEMWDTIREKLREKAKSGVKVRVMYDDVGCMGRLARGATEDLRADGIEAVCFARVSANVRNMRKNNNRDHRKLLIIDGSIAYTGGINVSDEYIGKIRPYGEWKDGGVRLFGDAALGFTRLFLELWCLARGGCEDVLDYFVRGDSHQSDGGYYIPFGSGPSPMYRGRTGKRAFIDIINQAQTYIYIMTPYLIIDYDLTEALVGAAGRGVDVRIMTPGVPDKPIVKMMTKGAYPRLLEGGVSIYEYTPGFLHSKAIVSDDLYAMVGTINLDYRSLVHHFEDAVWMYRSPVALDIRDDFLATLDSSHKMTKTELKLGLRERLLRSLIKLFAPLL